MGMARVFISHASKDAEEATCLLKWLQKQGFDGVFLDFDKYAGIPPGADWERTLYRELARAEAVILVFTNNWMASKWCFAEFAQARALGKPIFPLIESPAGETIVAPDIQHLDLRKDREGGLERLAAQLNEIALNARGGFEWDRTRSPFPGLLAYDEPDAAIFFGRDDEIRRLIERLNARRAQGGAKLLVLSGGSGSGKSSLMRAGVLPRLKRDKRNWIVLPPFRPQTHPFEELAQAVAEVLGPKGGWEQVHAALLGKNKEESLRRLSRDLRAACIANNAWILVSIDQGEELFVTADPDQVKNFWSLLDAMLNEHLPFIALVGLRSEYLEQLQRGLTAEIEQFLLKPLPLERVRDIIEGPASVVGLDVDNALTVAAIKDASTDDALPLLAFALRELYDRFAKSGGLTIDAYRALGDEKASLSPLENSVRKRAEQVIAEAKPTPEQMQALKDAFVPAMVRLDAEGEYVRCPARIDLLPAKAKLLLMRLVDARLLVMRDDTASVEVTHEALLRKWPLLRGWLDDAADDLRLVEDVRRAAREWVRKGRPNDWLDHRAERLYSAEKLVARKEFRERVDDDVMTYLVACRGRESIAFRQGGADLLRLGLERAGLDAKSFPWPPPGDRNRSAYRGLHALEFEDAAIFFGRDADILRGLDRIRGLVEGGAARFLVILGASGVGKSSFLRAGLLPRLARYDAVFLPLAVIQPTRVPISGLAVALAEKFKEYGELRTPARIQEILSKDISTFDNLIDDLVRIAKHRLIARGYASASPIVVLAIDQIENLLLGKETPEVATFIDILRRVVASSGPTLVRQIVVVATMRSDMYGSIQWLAEKIELFNLAPLNESQLYQVVRRPAELLGAQFETEEIANRIVRSAAEAMEADASALPLLSYFLAGMQIQMDERGDGVLRLSEEGMVGSAFANRFEEFLARHPGELDKIRRIFILRLAVMRADEGPIRRRALRSDFTDDEWRLVSELADPSIGLLVMNDADEAYVEVAHEAILRHWPRLRKWFEEEREFLVWRSEIEVFSREWERAPAHLRNDALLTGFALAKAGSWAYRRFDDLPPRDREFVKLSQHYQQRRRNLSKVSTAIAFAMSIIAAVLAYQRL
jgi:predicted AAA+ superfamily ATPase